MARARGSQPAGGAAAPAVAADPLLAVQQAAPRLSAAEARVAAVILDNPRAVVESTIMELAKACATSAATVARFCQSLGYSGYRDFRLEVAGAAGAERDPSGGGEPGGAPIDPRDSAQEVAEKILFQETRAISQTLAALDMGAVDAAVDAILAAERIELAGFASSGLSAQDLQGKLTRIGRFARYSPDLHLSLASAALLGPGSVLLGVSHSGLTLETNHLLRVAREAGATTIGLTNDPESAMAARCDILLCTQARESRFRSGATSGRIAQLAVIDVLFVRIAQRGFAGLDEPLRRSYDAVQWHREATERGDREN